MKAIRIALGSSAALAIIVWMFAYLAWPALLPGLIYYPRALGTTDISPESWGYDGDVLRIPAPEGDTIVGWKLRHTSSKPNGCVVLFMHGNAGNIAIQAGFMRPFLAAGFDALVFDYRGYGASTGDASEDHLYEEAELAYQYLVSEGIAPDHLLVVRHTFGTAVATELTSRRESAGLILAAPFTSLPDAMGMRVPWFPVGLLRWTRDRLVYGWSPDQPCTPRRIRGTSGETKSAPWHGGMMQQQAARTNEQTPVRLTPAVGRSAGTGYLLPAITLPTPSGERFELGQFSALRNLVVVLLGADAADESVTRLLTELAASRSAISDEEAEVLVVQTGDRSEWSGVSLPFTILVDEDRAFHRGVGAIDASGEPAPAVFIADRFREIYHVYHRSDADWPPSGSDVLEWLVFINIQCPECGAPEW